MKILASTDNYSLYGESLSVPPLCEFVSDRVGIADVVGDPVGDQNIPVVGVPVDQSDLT